MRSTSKGQIIAGRVVTGIAALFLFVDAAGKLARIAPVVEGSGQLGFSPETIFPIGLVLFVCTLLYVTPKTAPLGAVLLTGYLGGAVATHVRASNPLFSHTLFAVYVGIFVWAGLLLRRPELRVLLGLTPSSAPAKESAPASIPDLANGALERTEVGARA